MKEEDIRPAIKAMETMTLISLQHAVADSEDESDKQFRSEILLELGIREKAKK